MFTGNHIFDLLNSEDTESRVVNFFLDYDAFKKYVDDELKGGVLTELPPDTDDVQIINDVFIVDSNVELKAA